MNIYIASSWRNILQPAIVYLLRQRGHTVYDFRNPEPKERIGGFNWSFIDSDWEKWTLAQYKSALGTNQAERGYQYDYTAMLKADTCLVVLPCGKSAHLEAGWFVGAGKAVWFLSLEKTEPELMYKLAGRDHILGSIEELFKEF